MTPEEFDACFDGFASSVIRVETLQQYTVDEETQRIRAFLRGEPRPERSVRTSPWLARIATSTVGGRSWRRVHVVDLPLSDYLRYELVGYLESQACGEEIRIVERAAELAAAQEMGDFWLFDAGSPETFAIEMHYSREGRWLGAERSTATTHLTRLRSAADQIWSAANPLNQFLATPPRLQQARTA